VEKNKRNKGTAVNHRLIPISAIYSTVQYRRT